MLEPPTHKLVDYHVKEFVLHWGGREGQPTTLLATNETPVTTRMAVEDILNNSLKGERPAGAVLRFRRSPHHHTHRWIDRDGIAHAKTTVTMYLNAKLVIKDSKTQAIVAEQWFSLGREDKTLQLSERLTEKLRAWLGPTSRQPLPSAPGG
ncbi:MAG: hypothetical protein OXN81_02875 [Alphaproteobacteria bacterium]|nr:hypothetical protein [Alphaproteobacteria bacterium]